MAVVGKSGSGKSTIDLIMRFYDPASGNVSLDGHDLRDISRQSLKQFIALVSQDVFLDGTIRNITMVMHQQVLSNYESNSVCVAS